MSTLIRFPVSPDNIAGYRFAGVELHTASERLLVDGAEVPLSPMAFRLLFGLCRANGTMMTRNDVFDLLWPGGGSASDEALAQIVRKVRQALGDHARHLITVRARGFRIDADIEQIPLARPVLRDVSTSPPTPAAPDTAEASPLPIRQTRKPWIIALLVIVVGAIGAAYFLSPPDIELPGFGLQARDLGPISRAGVRTLRTALARESEGDRASATRLVETMLDSEPQSAVAPLYLVFWTGGGEREKELAHWHELLSARVPHDASPYLQLVVRWVQGVGEPEGTTLELLNAALKIEPSAWRLRLARAHVSLGLAHLDDTLADLREIPLDVSDARVVMIVLSDRASLGDADTMQAALPPLAKKSPAAADYVRGRIALARGQWRDAQKAFETAGADAEHDQLIGSLYRTWLMAAASAAMRDDWDAAAALLNHALRAGTEHNLPELLGEADLLSGYLQHRRGVASARDLAWDRAAQTLHRIENADAETRLWLLRARIDPAWALTHEAPAETEDAGVAPLTAARRAWASCDAQAPKLLERAEQSGIDDGYHAADADLLRQDLQLVRRHAPEVPRVPYPSFSRYPVYWDASQSAGARACAH